LSIVTTMLRTRRSGTRCRITASWPKSSVKPPSTSGSLSSSGGSGTARAGGGVVETTLVGGDAGVSTTGCGVSTTASSFGPSSRIK